MAAAIYLHGFASGPTSGKARFFAERLRARGIDLLVPDLNLPDFSSLTITRMLDQTRALIDAAAGPVTLIGSSLGGFVAVNAALRQPDRVDRLILLAPALDLRDFGAAGLDRWKSTGWLPVFHFGYGRMVRVGFELYRDAQRYDLADARLEIPVLIFQGRHDAVVNPDAVEHWARRRATIDLTMLDDDHQLGSSLESIWRGVEAFLARTDDRRVTRHHV